MASFKEVGGWLNWTKCSLFQVLKVDEGVRQVRKVTVLFINGGVREIESVADLL